MNKKNILQQVFDNVKILFHIRINEEYKPQEKLNFTTCFEMVTQFMRLFIFATFLKITVNFD